LVTIYFLLRYKYKFISSFSIITILDTSAYTNLAFYGLNNINIWLSMVILLAIYIVFYHYIYVYLFALIYNLIGAVIEPVRLCFNFFCIDLNLIDLYTLKLTSFLEFILYYYFLFFLFIM